MAEAEPKATKAETVGEKAYIPKPPNEVFRHNYKVAQLHNESGVLPVLLEKTIDKGSITFRADRNIEFFGFELYGLNPEFFTKDGQRFSITGQFKVYNGKKELLDDGISCELHGFFSDVRLCFPTRSRPIEANKWYRIDFKIKGPHLCFGKSVKKTDTISLEEGNGVAGGGAVNFEFKRGNSLGKVAGIMFDVLDDNVKMPLKDHPEGKCHYTATRFEEAHFGEKDGPKGHITFKVSKPIELSALNFFGPDPFNKKSKNFLNIDFQNITIGILNVSNGDSIQEKTTSTIPIAKDGFYTFEVALSRPVVLEADNAYKILVQTDGPTLVCGTGIRRQVVVKNTCPHRENQEVQESVTFSFIDEKNALNVEGITFAFI